MSNLVDMVHDINTEFSSFNDSQQWAVAHDLAKAIRIRASKHNEFLAPNLQRRDVVMCLLMFGLDMPAIDLLLDKVHGHLKKWGQ